MADKTTTSFAKMGTTVATTVDNLSGAPSANTIPVPKNGKGGTTYPEPSKGYRKPIQERLGAKYAPQADINYANAPELSGMTQRNVYTVPNRTGLRDFWKGRQQYGQGDYAG